MVSEEGKQVGWGREREGERGRERGRERERERERERMQITCLFSFTERMVSG